MVDGDAVFGATYASIYDAVYADRHIDEECDLVVDTARKHGSRAATLLDLGCGTGAHLAGFMRRDIACRGVDLSPAMLDLARQRLGPDAALDRGDVRLVRIQQRFDVVVALFHVLSYMTTDADVEAFLRTAEHHLAPGGVLFADFWYAPAVRALGASRRERVLAWAGRRVMRVAEPRTRAGGDVIDVHYEVVVSGGDRPSERLTEVHSMRAFDLPVLERAASASGLAIVASGAAHGAERPDERHWSAYLLATAAPA